MSDQARHLSRLALNQVASGLLGSGFPGGRGAELKGHLDTCGDCRAALAELQAHRDRFALQLLQPSLPRVLERADRWNGLKRRLRWALVPIPALATAALFLFLPRLHSTAELRAKGSDAVLKVIGERNGHVFTVKDGQALREGDEIRFAIDAPGDPYVLIASIDGAGKVNIYVPFAGSGSLAISPDRKFVSQDAVRLDAAPGPERLFALFGREPLASRAVAEQLSALGKAGPAAIREAHALPLLTDRQLSFLLEKETR